jgi:enoyl-CoA hydratase/carnithine racemase
LLVIKPTNDRLHAIKPEQARAETRQGHHRMGASAQRPQRPRRRGDPLLSLGARRVTDATSEILFERRGAAGLVTLNRPQALNAVTLGMVRAFTRQLQEWRDDPSITRVVLTAAGGRAFSAGGDVRALYDAGTAGRHDEMLAFYGEEYALNTIIKHYPKPYIALIDGIVMGGGVGVSVHGSHRVAGDRFSFAMPEVSIGLFPDVGATWFLPRLPGELGAYCALTGERLNAADGVAATIATHRVASSRFGDLATRSAARSRSMRRSRRSPSQRGEQAGTPSRRHRPAASRVTASRLFSPRSIPNGPTRNSPRPRPPRSARSRRHRSTCTRANAGRRDAVIPGVHANRIPHSVPRYSWPRLL